jgi:hypothetical protein
MTGHPYITTSETPRGRAEQRTLAAMQRAWPDREFHYVFGGFIVVPKGTPMTCASTLETLWERLMAGPSPASTVAGTVVREEPNRLLFRPEVE